MAITFSFREKKRIEGEKYDYPVLTQLPYSGEKHSVAKFQLNKAALAELGYPENLKGCKISVGIDDETGNIVLVNSTDMETPNQFNVNMDGSVNSKFLSGRLAKEFGSSPAEFKEFALQTVRNTDLKACEVGEMPLTMDELVEQQHYIDGSEEAQEMYDLFSSESEDSDNQIDFYQ